MKKDKDFAHLQHPDGHVFKVAINALHPENRKNLDKLKMAHGGEAEDPTQRHLLPGDKIPNQVEKAEVDKYKEPQKFANGGLPEVPAAAQSPNDENIPLPGSDIPYDKLPPESDPKGPEANRPSPQDDSPAHGTPPVVVNVGNPQMQGPVSQGGMPVAQSPDQAAQGPVQPTAPAQPPQAAPKQPPLPTTMGGYQQQVGGIQQEANAQAAIGKQQYDILKGQAEAGTKMMSDYQTAHQALDNERQNFQQDIMNKHIDPNHYMGQQGFMDKMMTAAGLILGGMGGGGGSNQALDFLNRQIDRDIDAQKAELGKTENLLGANLKQYGNLNDATAMTKAMMTDTLNTKLNMASASQADPMAKAKANQLMGQLQQQVAPSVMQMAMRQSLMSGNTGDQDPASYVPYVVPEARQKDVLHEIGTAQNAQKNEDQLMKYFDEADKENTIGGRVMHAGFAPASILNMRAMMLPIIHDAEGRVNEFEQKTTSDLEPKPGDSPAKVAAKRQGLQAFLHQKMAAPNAKAYGIDLDHFKSTATNPEARLNPQQQAFVQWAKSNPNNPKAQMVLKKLGIQWTKMNQRA